MAYVADYRQIRILEKDIEKLSIENANLRTNIAQKDLQIKAENKRGNSYASVSYTHLDVYKRQILSTFKFLYC